VRPVTVNGGYAMRAWYDILNFDRDAPQDLDGIRQTHRMIAGLLAREAGRGVPHERIVIAGFSQGGAMALYSGVRQSAPLAGILALSCYLLDPARFDAERQADTLRTPVFLAHGEYDEVLPLALGERARERLEQAGYAVEWHQYPMPHSVAPEEIAHIGRWLARVLAPR
jgi:phospholipase/carboxylesterase